MKKTGILSLITVVLAFIMSVTKANATCEYGILNNGLGGIYIDINSEPYTTFATYKYGTNACTQEGCAWFASARVNQLTGKGSVIRSASNWWNNHSSYGFSRGSTPQAGSIICLTKSGSEHVAILEKIEGSTAYISEGGFRSAGANYGYCKIRTIEVSKIASTYQNESGLSLLGYVYMGIENDGNYDTPSPTFSPVDLGSNFYGYIGHQSTGKWLTNVNNNIEGSDPTGNPEQIWNFIRQSDGSYVLRNTYDNSYMDVWGTSTETGTNIYCCNLYTGAENQRFFIYYMYDAYYFKPVYANMHLDMSSSYNLELWGAGEDWAPQEFDICEQSLHSTIQFEAKNAINSPASITKKYGDSITISNDIPSKENFIFKTWNTKANGSGVSYNPGDIYNENKSITLYAQWEEIIPYTSSVVSKSSTGYSVKTTIHNIDTECDIMIAGYKNNHCVALKKISSVDLVTEQYINADVEEIKIMVWDSISSLKPLCNTEIIPYDKFIL